ncbi:MAG: efflux RND transporter periplasmic adaptor subunit, partial [candidate division WOR-3 bacterium]|nr:efflux RND transporter periplasmic adaptor subunit [candidate division WOR-3 bacterium]
MKKRILIISGIIAFFVIVIVLNLREKGDYKRVEIQRAKVGEIVSSVFAPGEITAEKEVKICSDIIGKVTKVYIKEGQDVEKEALLFIIDPSSFEAEVEQKKASLNLAQANFKKARRYFEKEKKLFEKGLVSREEFENSEIELEIAKAGLEEAKSRLKYVISNLNKTNITSPISGKVIDLNIEEGEIVITGTMNNPGTVLAKVVDTENMIADVRVNEADIVNIRLNQRAKIFISAFPKRNFDGEVIEIGGKIPSLEEKREFRIRVRIDNPPQALRPGISCDVEIETAKIDSAI